MTCRFSSAFIGWFSPKEPRKIMPLTPDSISTSAWRAVASRSIEPSLCIWVVMAGNTPCHFCFMFCQLFLMSCFVASFKRGAQDARRSPLRSKTPFHLALVGHGFFHECKQVGIIRLERLASVDGMRRIIGCCVLSERIKIGQH